MESKKKRILLVDDEPSIMKMVAKRLEVAGFEVLTAMDGEAGLETAKTQNPDLVILDLMLPKRNGFEVCLLLKKDPETKKIPIIMFSARASEKDEKAGLECGADAYMRKPFQSQELLDQIRSMVESSKAQPD